MTRFINFTELYSSGGSFARQEVTESTSNGTTTTTVYGGYSPVAEPGAAADANPNWIIRRLVVVDNGTTQSVQCTWSRGAWNDRASLEYRYHQP